VALSAIKNDREVEMTNVVEIFANDTNLLDADAIVACL
jgi:hypothetical protein